MEPSPRVNSADYADALLVARKARSLLILLLLLVILIQLGLFFVARYKIDLNGTLGAVDKLKYLVGLCQFLGVILPIILAATLMLIVLIMLQGRVVGVAGLVRAFVVTALLATLLFPWQAFLINQTFTSDQFRIPGVLYSWSELLLRARYRADAVHDPQLALLFWARFVGWPLAAIALLVKIHFDSSKGLSAALRTAPPAEPVRQPITGVKL